VFEGSGSRVVKFEHNTGRVLGVPSQSVALLATLTLRGPQTAAELRLNCERLHRFADISSVDGFLDELAAREPQRVAKLARAPGARESRWVHLLCGEPPAMQHSPEEPLATPSQWATLEARVVALEAQVAALMRQGAAESGSAERLRLDDAVQPRPPGVAGLA